MSTAAQCQACNRLVSLEVTEAPVHGGGQATLAEPEVVCLDFGSECSGCVCPFSGLPALVMGVRLARSHLPPTRGWKMLKMRCDRCERVTDMEVLDNVHAFCTQCETTNRWFELELGEERYLVALEMRR
jgi:RNA polymerase subunit RPABC4/transcription elongation factor Spt4